jgi:hypothetical protein
MFIKSVFMGKLHTHRKKMPVWDAAKKETQSMWNQALPAPALCRRSATLVIA